MMARFGGSGNRPFGYFLLELVLIFVSVFLAFSVSQWQETRRDRQLAEVAIHNIAHEIHANLIQVDDSISLHKDLVPAMRHLPDSAFAGKDAFTIFIELLEYDSPRIPLLERSAFDAAIASGAVQQFDYEVLARISHLYNAQSAAFGISITAIGEFIRDADMFKQDEAKPQIRALTLVFQNIYGSETYYANETREVLALLNDTYGLDIEIPARETDAESDSTAAD